MIPLAVAGSNCDRTSPRPLLANTFGSCNATNASDRFHLRVLQTDLVKAIQAELDAQSNQLNEIDGVVRAAASDQGTAEQMLARMQQLETAVASLASTQQDDRDSASNAPVDDTRLATLESRLNDTASSVESLAELQRRTTNLDTSLTQSMSNITAALEQSNGELAALRAQLDAANARISELESAPPIPAQPVDPPMPEAAPPPMPVVEAPFDPVGLDSSVDEPPPEVAPEAATGPEQAAMPVTDVIGETIRDEVLTPRDETDWFVASYAKKHQKDQRKPPEEEEPTDGDEQEPKKRRFRR